jgi:hypothetical protein
MPIQIKADEAINAQCVIQDFTCILTSTRLIVKTPAQEESYPLEEIAAIGVYEDKERSSRNTVRRRIKRALLGAACGFLFGAAFGLVAFIRYKPDLGIFLIVMFLTMAIPISLMMPLDKTKALILRIVFKQSPAKQYVFRDMGYVSTNERSVTTFTEKVFAQVSNPSKKAFALN